MIRISLLVGVAVSLLAGHAVAQEVARPNFVVVLCDDLGYGDLGCFGHPTIKTPNLDSFAAKGVKLTQFYCPQPVCSPSRAGMLTGKIPHRLGIDDWIPANSPIHLRQEEVTVAKLLKGAGYATAHVGKWHCNGKFNSPEQAQPGDHGFDHWFSTQNNAVPSHENPANFVRNGKRVGDVKGYSSQIIVDEALTWLKTVKAGTPYCLFVWFHSPHEKVATAPDFVKMYPDAKQVGQAEYFGNVTQMDAEFGRLMKNLEAMKLAENTVVLFTSDNGPETLKRYKGAERSHGSPGELRGMKLHLWEGGIRVPAIARWPGKLPEGESVDVPISGLDLLPTFCALAGVKLPADLKVDGTDLTPLLKDEAIQRPTPLFWAYDKALGGPTVALRDGDWKLVAWPDFKRFELYNLREDAKESQELSTKHPDQVQRMRERLMALHKEIESGRPVWPTTQPAARGAEK